MSAREWKTGDIVVITIGAHTGRIGLAGDRCVVIADESESGGYSALAYGQQGARPLLVIDPEDMSQVNDLIGALAKARSEDPLHVFDPITVQQALRSLLTPPKPPEPQGLGAVVRDADDETWVRVNVRTGTAEWRSIDAAPTTAYYGSIDAVEVLSEGVTP